MFSYRHAFHAGNHADVLKHLILVQIFQYLRQKDKPFWYFDTHAGAGRYALEGAWARKTQEASTGIQRLWGESQVPAAVADYLEQIRQINPDGQLRVYPGSPWLGWQMLGERDRLRLFEWHPTEIHQLHETMRALPRETARRTMIYAANGFEGLKALLPPPPRRGVVLIDPAYEDKNDYRHVFQTVKEGLERFATGTYAIWYPLIQRREAQALPEKLARLPGVEWLHATLLVGHPQLKGIGLHGSGMFIINPPYTLQATLNDTLPWLARTLAGENGRFSLQSSAAPKREHRRPTLPNQKPGTKPRRPGELQAAPRSPQGAANRQRPGNRPIRSRP